jgi:galactoside 2-L-fucosyltransferase 1/2
MATSPPLVLKPFIGRLGNQIFQWASAYGLARKHNASLCIESSRGWTANIVRHFVGPFDECSAWHSSLKPCSLAAAGAPCVRQYSEQGPHRFDNLPVREPYVRFINAFLASYRYFEGVETEVRQRLQFRPHIRAAARANVARSPCIRAHPSAALVGVHVRRTDRLGLGVWPNTTYFRNAMAHLRARHAARGACFVIESDDVRWCHNQRLFRAADVHIDNETRRAVALAVLGRCQDHILSVGTFGWWGAWLGRAKEGSATAYFAQEDIGQRDRRPPLAWVKNQHKQAGSAAPALLPRGVLRDYFPPEWLPFDN